MDSEESERLERTKAELLAMLGSDSPFYRQLMRQPGSEPAREMADELPKWRAERPIPPRSELSPLQEWQCRILGGALLEIVQDWVKGMRDDQKLLPAPEFDLVRSFHPTLGDLNQRALLIISDVPGLVAVREILGDKVLESGDWEFETKGGLRARAAHPHWPRVYPILAEESEASQEFLGEDCGSYWEFTSYFEAVEKSSSFGDAVFGGTGLEGEKKKWRKHLAAWREKLPSVTIPDTLEEALPNLYFHTVGVYTAPLAGSTQMHLWLWSGEELHLLEEGYVSMVS
jgi:hypothetical protein